VGHWNRLGTIGTFCPKRSEDWIRSFESAPTCFGRWMVVRMGVQMNTGIALMTSIFASVLTFFGSRRAARQYRLTNIGTGPSNLNHTDRRSKHRRVKNDGRAGDDWTTALAKRWQYAFIHLFTAYTHNSTTLANSPGSSTDARPVGSCDRTITSAAVRCTNGISLQRVSRWVALASYHTKLADCPSDEGKMASTQGSTAVSYAALASNMLSAILKVAASVFPWRRARSLRRMQCVC
jgi:hypothetical protein